MVRIRYNTKKEELNEEYNNNNKNNSFKLNVFGRFNEHKKYLKNYIINDIKDKNNQREYHIFAKDWISVKKYDVKNNNNYSLKDKKQILNASQFIHKFKIIINDEINNDLYKFIHFEENENIKNCDILYLIIKEVENFVNDIMTKSISIKQAIGGCIIFGINLKDNIIYGLKNISLNHKNYIKSTINQRLELFKNSLSINIAENKKYHFIEFKQKLRKIFVQKINMLKKDKILDIIKMLKKILNLLPYLI